MPRWQMEVVELSDQAGGHRNGIARGGKKGGRERRGERTKPVAEGDRITFASKIRYKVESSEGEIHFMS